MIIIACLFISHNKTVWSVCFSHNDQFVVTGYDDYICVFNTNTGHEEKRFEGHTDSVSKLVCFDFIIMIIFCYFRFGQLLARLMGQ